jgi:type IV pilus assembly protein PilE
MRNKMASSTRGFTLIELLVVITIVGILVAMAVPSYQQHVLKSRRADGTAALLKLQLAQEKFRANCRFYAGGFGNAVPPCAASAGASTLDFSTSSENNFYTIAIAAADGNSYTITADPKNQQASDSACDPIQITYPAGDRTPAGC